MYEDMKEEVSSSVVQSLIIGVVLPSMYCRGSHAISSINNVMIRYFWQSLAQHTIIPWVIMSLGLLRTPEGIFKLCSGIHL